MSNYIGMFCSGMTGLLCSGMVAYFSPEYSNDPSLYDGASPQYNIQSGKAIPWLHQVHQNSSDRVYANNRFKDSLVANGYPNVSLFNANPYDHETINQALGNPLDSIGETQSVMAFFGHCIANNLTTAMNQYYEISSSISIYPNPTNTTLFIKTESNNSLQYQITNSIGQVLHQEKVNGNIIDVSSLREGIYFILFRDAKGSVFVTKFFKN
jgi:hypothetical protein